MQGMGGGEGPWRGGAEVTGVAGEGGGGVGPAAGLHSGGKAAKGPVCRGRGGAPARGRGGVRGAGQAGPGLI